MRCPIDFRSIPANDWSRLTDAIQRGFDELYRQDEYRNKEYVRNGQKDAVELSNLVVFGSVRNHKYKLAVNDSSPDAPVIELLDTGR